MCSCTRAEKANADEIQKNLKKEEKVVDKWGMIWYIKQAVSDDGAIDGELKKFPRNRKKGLTKRASSGRISKLFEGREIEKRARKKI